MAVTSPCTGICKLDDATGWCLGCGRSGEEIFDWAKHPEAWRAKIWDQIPGRLSQLGVACRRLPWRTQELRAFVAESLRTGHGTWTMGVVGAVAEFTAAPGQSVDVHQKGEVIRAQTGQSALRMVINDDVRALSFDPAGAPSPRIVLAVKRERGRVPFAAHLADLGTDSGALQSEAATQLFDLGLARKEARFCVRVAPGPAQAALQAATGLPFNQALPHIAGPLIAESPTRVIESALGRVEVGGPIPPPDAQSPAGSHTHLLPDHLASGRATPVGMELPRAYLPGAIFYPPREGGAVSA